MAGRGGRRLGAGRKAELTYEQKLAIGARCEGARRKVLQAHFRKAMERRIERLGGVSPADMKRLRKALVATGVSSRARHAAEEQELFDWFDHAILEARNAGEAGKVARLETERDSIIPRFDEQAGNEEQATDTALELRAPLNSVGRYHRLPKNHTRYGQLLPNASRSDIVNAIQRKFSYRYCRPISRRAVEDAWRTFIDLEARIKNDTDTFSDLKVL